MALVNNSSAGVGGAAGLLPNLIKQFQQSQTDANNAGNTEYQNLLKSVASTQTSILGKNGYLTNAGNQARADTQQATANSVGQANQSFIDRGLYNTSFAPSAIAGIQNKGQQSLNNIDEAVAGQKAGVSLDLGKLNADSILSKQNQGPDMGMYLQLIQHLASMQNQVPTKSFSNAGSINALNGPPQYSMPAAAPAPPPAQTGAYYNAATMGGGLSRPGDQYFGSF